MRNKIINILIKARDLSGPAFKSANSKAIGFGSGINKSLVNLRDFTTANKSFINAQKDFNNVQRNTGQVFSAFAKASTVGAAAGFLFKKQFVDVAAQFETFNTLLEQAEGSSQKGRKAYEWINEFSRKTPLQFQGVLDSYLKLKNFGIDPTNGSLKALVDQNSALGGDQVKLNGIILAVGQAWSKQKLQGEEALQLIERGVPVWQILADATGKTTAEIQEMIAKGQLGHKAIKLLIDEMGRRNLGSSNKQMKTFNGMMSNLMDMSTRFRLLIMRSGVFEFLSSSLKDVLSRLNEMEKSGALKVLAKDISQDLISTLKMAVQFGKAAWKALVVLGKAVNWLADVFGGFENLMIAFAIFMAIKWVGSVLLFIQSLVVLGSKVSAIGWVSNAFILLGNILKGVALFFVSNPIGIAIALLATAAFLIIKNWKPIKAFFVEIWGGIKDAFDKGFLSGILYLIENFSPIGMMLKLAKKMSAALVNAFRSELPEGLLSVADRFLGTGQSVLKKNSRTLTSGGNQPGQNNAKVDVHVGIDSEGRPEVKSAKVSGTAAGELDVDAGMMMAGAM